MCGEMQRRPDCSRTCDLGVAADWGVPGSWFQPPDAVLVWLGCRRVGVRFPSPTLARKLRRRSPGPRLSLLVGVLAPDLSTEGAVITFCSTGPIIRPPADVIMDFILLSPEQQMDDDAQD